MTDLRAELQASLGTAYTIERELGGGGMSRVFLAEDVALGRQVVVKVLPPEMAGGMSIDRFRREIQVAARLQHPHIVPLLSAGHSADLLYFTMPFVTGESLRTRLVRGELPVVEAVRILREVADALAYAHKQGVVHRDIKPENVLLSEGHALVTDFGVAKAVSTATGSGGSTSIGIAVGTPAYMSPEQASADPTSDHRVDIYAFGVLSYELLVGEPPFRGRTAHELIAAHMTQTPEPVTKRRGTVPEALSALIARCLEKRPSDRPQSAEEIVHVLDSAITPGGHLPGYTTSGSRAPTRARSRLPIAIAGAVTIAGLAIVGLWWRSRDKVATDARLVAVFPFRVAGADPSLAYLREGMIDLLAAKLTGSTRVVDPRSALAAWRSAGGSETNDIDRAAAVRLSAKFGAGEVLLGDVTGGAGNVVFRASLVPVNGGDARDATIEGSQDSLPALVDRLAVQLLALRTGEDVSQLGGLAGTPLSAIRDYLEGQRLGRRGTYRQAHDRFASSVKTDSNFAAAWYGLMDMQGWLSVPRDTAMRQLARLRDRLTPATRALVDVRVGPRYPISPTLAEMRQLAERATQVAPDDPFTWQYLGDVYFHWASAIGIEDASQRSIAAFERALALDSTFHPAIEHLPWLYYERGDTAAMRRWVDAAMATDSAGEINAYLADVVLGDARRGARWRALLRDEPRSAANLEGTVTHLGLSLRLIDSLGVAQSARAVTDQERLAMVRRLVRVAHVRGQPGRAAKLARSVGRVDRALAQDAMLETLFGDGDSTFAAEARIALDPGVASDSIAPNSYVKFVAALWDMQHGKPETARRAVTQLGSPACASPAATPTMCADFALILVTLLASQDNSPDAPARLAQLDSMLRVGPVNQGPLLQVGNLVAARMWEKQGDAQRALSATRRRVRFYGGMRFQSTYLREEGRLAAATGDREGAVRAYRQYLALRDDVEPALKEHVASVRRELTRLEREQAGR